MMMITFSLTIERAMTEFAHEKTSRRVYIDVIRVGLTWGILLFHTVLIYMPLGHYYIKDPFFNAVHLVKPTLQDIVSCGICLLHIKLV